MQAPPPISPAYFEALITEADVLKRFGNLLCARELREARAQMKIEFVRGKKGLVQYHPDAIALYLERKVIKCPQSEQGASGNTADIGSAPLPAPTISMPTGTISEQDERTAEVLRQKFSPKLKTA